MMDETCSLNPSERYNEGVQDQELRGSEEMN